MKLIRCYIENFGGLHQYSLELSDGLTVVQEDNGFGKTTLAAFLKCMFYGMPRGNKGALDKDLRRKYIPWQGGTFGGNLEFQVDGETYRLERTFGDKPSGDTFILYRLPGMEPSNRFSKDIGRELFGLDGDSFERSTYFPQTRERLNLSTDGIQAGLTHLVEDSDDVGHYQRAVELLRKARSTYQPYRGTGGQVEEAGHKVAQLEEQIESCQQDRQLLEETKQTIEELKSALEESSRQLSQAQGELAQLTVQGIDAAKQRENQLLEEQSRLREEARKLLTHYPKGLPNMEEVSAAAQAADRLAMLEEEETPAAVVKAQEQLEDGNARFAGGIPDEEALEQAQAAWETCLRLTNQKQDAAQKGSSPVGWIVIALGGMFLLAGIALLVLSRQPLGVVAILVGIITLVAGVALLREKKGDDTTESEAELTVAENTILALVGGTERDPVTLGRKLSQLRQDCNTLLQAQRLVAEYDARLQQQDEQRRQWQRTVEGFFQNYQLTAVSQDRAGLEQIATDVRRGQELEDRYRQRRAEWKRAVQSAQKEESSIRRQELEEDVKELSQSIGSFHRLLAERQQTAKALAQRAEEEDSLRQQLDHWRRLRQQGQRKVALLDRTISYLEEARRTLSESYLDRLQAGLRRYLAQLTDASQAAFVDQNLNIKVEQGGKARELAYFSAGSEDLVLLCMRLALVDTLFAGKETPLLILDDPFVNLDEKNMARALKLLRQKAEEGQILYLVCHGSRT
jgi:DNA repair exonuclease SbcCD ATPase subunit